MARLVTPRFTRRAPAACEAVVEWTAERSICLGAGEASVLEADGGSTPLGASSALAVTPSGVWSVSTADARFLPSDGGRAVSSPQRSHPRAIATLADRVFVAAEEGLTELTPGQTSPLWSLSPPSGFPPTAMRVEPPDLLIARQERTERVPLALVPDRLPDLTPAGRVAVRNFNAVAGLWRVEGSRVTLTTDAGQLELEVPLELTRPGELDFGPSPVVTDETPLLQVGLTPDGRPVWLQPVEPLDGGGMAARYLVAPPDIRLGRADSQHVFARGPDGVFWAPRR